MKFLNIFPTSIVGEIQNNILDKEVINYKNFLLNEKYLDNGTNGECSHNQKILENPLFTKLKNNILLLSRKYLKEQDHLFEDVQITNSWSNKLSTNQSIYPHSHENSYLSGVFYLDFSSPIQFTNPLSKLWIFKPEIKVNTSNPQQSKNYYLLHPQPKLLLIFPSFLTHLVTKNSNDKERVSIAFNIIPKGEFGEITAKMYL
jgi:uncharacterized protein (TIGR02466 family)